ncbi:MAG: AgmX/PglI C-terminal domain-containing protein [Deltaproteobacteria bacterium]|nr:AgmX/PglI C-terminal domain-containing protein [Deltaproteobacteria bacterium]
MADGTSTSSLTPDGNPKSRVAPLRFSVFEPGKPPRVVDGAGAVVKVGRAPTSTLRLEDPSVEAVHAVIETAPDGGLWLIDLGSRSGTFLNRERIQKKELHPSDEIRFGGTLVRLVTDATMSIETEPAVRHEDLHTAVLLGASSKEGKVAERRSGLDSRDDAQLPIAGFGAPPGFGWSPEGERTGEGHRGATQPGRSAAQGAEAVVLTVRWGASTVVHRFLGDGEGVSVGDGPASDFFCTAAHLPAPTFPLLIERGGSRWLHLVPELSGTVGRGDSVLPLSALATSAERGPGQFVASFTVPFPLGSTATLWLDPFELELTVARRPRTARTPWFASINPLIVLAFLVSLLLNGGTLLVAAIQPDDPHGFSRDRFDGSDRFSPTQFKPEVHPLSERERRILERMASTKVEPKDGGRRHAGKSGRAGIAEGPQRRAKLGIKAPDTTTLEPGEKKRRDVEVVKSTKLMQELERIERDPSLGRLFRPTGGAGEFHVSSDWGKGVARGGDRASGAGSPTDVGPNGDRQGEGGFGDEGSAEGGGGIDRTVGIGNVNTAGQVQPARAALPLRKRTKLATPAGFGPPVSTGDVTFEGNIDREMVRRIIRQRLKEIQYCYQVEFEKLPNLSGKVIVSFGILTSGEVDGCKIRESTLKNANVEGCMCSKIKRWEFQRSPYGERVTVTYPFLFKAAGRN